MKIAIRNGKNGAWKRIPPDGDKNTDEYIQDLVHQIPELISVEGSERNEPNLKVCIKNSQGNGSQDDGGLIGIDGDGSITIVECKIADGSSARRQVVGQALEYAASLWEITYEEFDSMVLDSEGKSLSELMGERLPAEDWSEDKFKESITSALQQGKFRLVMTVNGITDELKRTIKFLNARGPFSFDTYAVEILHFSDGQVDIVVPKIMSFTELEGDASTKSASPSQESNKAEPVDASSEQSALTVDPAEPILAGQKQSIDTSDPSEPIVGQSRSAPAGRDEQKEALFFAKCEENVTGNALSTIKKIYAFSTEVADDIMWWGSSGAGAFNFVLTEDSLTVFIIDASGRIMFNFSEWQKDPTYKDLLPVFLEKLKNVSVLRKQKGDYTRWPDFTVEEFFAKSDDFGKFSESIKFLKDGLSKLVAAR